MIKKLILLITLLVITVFGFSQYKKVKIDVVNAKSKKALIEPIKSKKQLTHLSYKTDNKTSVIWNKSVKSMEKTHKLSNEIERIKNEKTILKIQNHKNYNPDTEKKSKTNNITPILDIGFDGNIFDGAVPPDNSVAISNGGYIVSVINSNVEFYNTSGKRIYSKPFYDFFNDDSLTAFIYDPVVLYDSDKDRFFMVVLHGNSSSTSKVILCFSKSNNPRDGWWIYKLTGNPLNNNSWFDYPKIGVSNNEVYVTGNLYLNSDIYNQSIIYQIEKSNGYSGAALSWQYWSNLSKNPFTLVPVSYGHQGNYGPGTYFVCTDENGILRDKYRLYDLNDDMSGSPSINVYSINADFSLAGNAFQKESSVKLDNGDNRALSAFYLDGICHFVFSSEYKNNYNGINYNRINISDLTNTSKIIGLEGFDYSYPSVASFTTSSTDKSVMICFLKSGSTIYPELRAISCDNDMNWSTSVLVKEGTSYVNNEQTIITRWGDYTGISRKHNATSPEVWLNGHYGIKKYFFNYGVIDCYETRIAKITTNANSIKNDLSNKKNDLKIFPNPVYDMFYLKFHLKEKTQIKIAIYDINGKLTKLLYQDTAHKGENLLSFNKDALRTGIYFIRIDSDLRNIKNEKIIIK